MVPEQFGPCDLAFGSSKPVTDCNNLSPPGPTKPGIELVDEPVAPRVKKKEYVPMTPEQLQKEREELFNGESENEIPEPKEEEPRVIRKEYVPMSQEKIDEIYEEFCNGDG